MNLETSGFLLMSIVSDLVGEWNADSIILLLVLISALFAWEIVDGL